METMEIEIAKLQQEYIGTFASKESELRELAAAGDADALAKALHKIAGSGGTYRMHSLSTSCRALELALLKGSVALPAHKDVVELWLQFFSRARASYEQLTSGPAREDYERWHDAVGRVDTALAALWDKIARVHNALQGEDEEAA